MPLEDNKERKCKNPQVEILMATYNGSLYIGEQIESIISQSYTNWKLIIKDDCSTDHTMEILQEYQEQYPEKIQVHRSESPTGSAKNNFFDLLRLAISDYIMCCDQDDIWNENKVEISLGRILELEKEGKSNILVYTDLAVVDGSNTVIAESFEQYSKLNCNKNKLNTLLVENVVTGCTMIFNKELLDQALLVTEVADIKMHDYWLALVASILGKIDYLKIPTIHYRQHQNNSVGAQNNGSIQKLLHKFINKQEAVKSMEESRIQAELLYKTYGKVMSEKDTEVINAFITMSDKCKAKRMLTMVKYKIYKDYIFKRIGLILWA